MQLYYFAPCETVLPCQIILGPEESAHCIKVMRMRPDDSLYLSCGDGKLYKGKILNNDAHGCAVQLETLIKQEQEPAFEVHIAVAPTKNIARLEWFLEKATEIGITEITPLFCAHSERVNLRIDRLQKIILAAGKQSLKLRLPILHSPAKFSDFINKLYEGEKYIAYVQEQQPVQLKNKYSAGNNAVVLIGPEGDFTPEEVLQAIEKDYFPVSLGAARLRTETAALVACHTINLLNE